MGEAGERTTRAVTWLTLAGLAVLVAGIIYLRPGIGSPGPSGPSARVATPSPAPGARLVNAVFRDASHGTVSLSSNSIVTPTDATSYVTADGGRTWVKASEPGFTYYESRELMVRQSAAGMRLSTDDGRTWRTLVDPRGAASSSGSSGGPITFLDARDGWWFLPPSSLWRTRDGGRSWSRLGAHGLPPEGVGQLTFTDSAHGFITVYPSSLLGARNVLVSEDGGETWHQVLSVTSPIPGSAVLAFAVFPLGSRLVAGIETIEGLTFSADGRGLSYVNPTVVSHIFTMASEDRGNTWGPLRAGPTETLTAASGLYSDFPTPGSGELVMFEGRRLWTSVDGGISWVARVAVIPEGLYPVGPIQAVPGAMFVEATNQAPSARSGPVLLGRLQLLRSHDAGVHWAPVPLPAPAAR